MPRIMVASYSRNSLLIKADLQAWVSSLMSSLTLASGGNMALRETNLATGIFGSHLSSRIRTNWPSPILHPNPKSITWQACRRLFQAKEPLFELTHSMTEHSGKNLALKTLCSKVSSHVCNLQICLAKRESLNLLSSRKPMPPLFFGRQLLPAHQVDFSLLPSIPPPKFSNQWLNFLYKAFKESKAWHSVGRDHLDDCFYKNLTTYLR